MEFRTVLWCLPGRIEVEAGPSPVPVPAIERAPRRKPKRAGRGGADKLWADGVKARDRHACQECGSSARLHAHHVLPVATHPRLRHEPLNGVTLCRRHHRERHPELPASLFR